LAAGFNQAELASSALHRRYIGLSPQLVITKTRLDDTFKDKLLMGPDFAAKSQAYFCRNI
jgi:hypothetical protein